MAGRYPGFARNCNSANGNTLFENEEFEPIASIYNKYMTYKIDGASEHSGGPLFYCPKDNNDRCLSGEKGFVFGVFAGWNSVTKRHVGPKVPNFRTTALAFIND